MDPLALLPLAMFVCLGALMFTSLPVAYILGGLAFVFAGIGWSLDLFQPVEFLNMVARIWAPAENLALIAVPCFIFMGVMLDRSGVASDLMVNVSRLFGRVRGGLAVTVALIGILPTLVAQDLQRGAMTDEPRYRALSAALRQLRRGSFRMEIDGEEAIAMAQWLASRLQHVAIPVKLKSLQLVTLLLEVGSEVRMAYTTCSSRHFWIAHLCPRRI